MTNETKHAGGRPTLYTHEIGQQVLELFYEGMSICAIARHFRVDRGTIYNWKDNIEEFFHTFKKGLDWSQGCWEEKGRNNLHDKTFNHVLWIMNMKCRFPEWREAHEEKESNNDEIQKDRELAHKCKTE
jgi:predicted DNA-binding protein YlxM (UPF0122 family)